MTKCLAPDLDVWNAPCGFAAGDTNLYRYVGNRATTSRDPSGLETEEPPLAKPKHLKELESKLTADQKKEIDDLHKSLNELRAAQQKMTDITKDLAKHIAKPFDGKPPTYSESDLDTISKDYQVVRSTGKDDIISGRWKINSPKYVAIKLGEGEEGKKKWMIMHYQNQYLEDDNESLNRLGQQKFELFGSRYEDGLENPKRMDALSYWTFNRTMDFVGDRTPMSMMNNFIEGSNSKRIADAKVAEGDFLMSAWLFAAHVCPGWNLGLTIAEQKDKEKQGGTFDWGEVTIAAVSDGTVFLGIGAAANASKANRLMSAGKIQQGMSTLRTARTMFVADGIIKTGAGVYSVASGVKELGDGNSEKGWLKITQGMFLLVGAKNSGQQYTAARDALLKAEKAVAAQSTKAATVCGSEIVDTMLGKGACFAAGTPLLTPGGHKLVEQFVAGDQLLSRDQWDPYAPVVVRHVEEVFLGLARIRELRVGRQTIRTTDEHPFWVVTKGWLPAREVLAGDRLLSHDGMPVVVSEVVQTDGWEAVYNLRVADDHTYFVGCNEWGFSVWAHNNCYQELIDIDAKLAKPEGLSKADILQLSMRRDALRNAGVHLADIDTLRYDRFAKILEENGISLKEYEFYIHAKSSKILDANPKFKHDGFGMLDTSVDFGTAKTFGLRSVSREGGEVDAVVIFMKKATADKLRKSGAMKLSEEAVEGSAQTVNQYRFGPSAAKVLNDPDETKIIRLSPDFFKR